MARLAQRIRDKRVLKLIRRFLQAGVMENGLVSPVDVTFTFAANVPENG